MFRSVSPEHSALFAGMENLLCQILGIQRNLGQRRRGMRWACRSRIVENFDAQISECSSDCISVDAEA